MEHYPVMLNESLDWLNVRPDGVFLDATAGLGNHSRAIAERLVTGRLVMHDRDGESLEQARGFTADYADRITPVRGRFSELRQTLDRLGLSKVDGLLADLGVSRPQLTASERGFSFMNDGPLDMRMSREENVETAADLVRMLPSVVASGGRAVVISFHSLEDRLVKQGFLTHARGGRARILTKHVVRPSEVEVRTNAASRSAKLRAIEIV